MINTSAWNLHSVIRAMLHDAIRLRKVKPIDAGELLALRLQHGLFRNKLERVYFRRAKSQPIPTEGVPAE